MIPHLTTALTGPLQKLGTRILSGSAAIEPGSRTQWQEHTPPLYGSVGLRNSGFRLAPVDVRLCAGRLAK